MNKIKTRLTTANFTSLFRMGNRFSKIAVIGRMFLIVFVLTSCKDSNTDTNAKIEVAAAVDMLNNAIVNQDEELLKDIALPHLTYGHSTGVIEDRQEFMDQVLNGDFDYTSVGTSDQTIQVSGDMAIVRHILSIEGSNAGQPTSLRLGVILGFQKQGGNWRLLARQGYKL
tara:strand:+ start:10029 stop:10538 length:510 start_codon:yes stop_codon:yes gene_type:complete